MAITIEWQVKPPSKVRRTSERRAELVRAIPSEEEEDEANRLLTTVKSRRARREPSLLELSRVRRRKTKSKLTKKYAEERVKDHSFCLWAKCSNSTENCN